METYARIKSLCDAHGIRFSALASAVGVRSSVFTELKMGRTKQLSSVTLRKIADYFEVSTDSLLSAGTDSTDEKRDELFAKRKLLFDLSANATADELDTIIKIVNALVQS